MTFVGMDWSGTPETVSHPEREFYICCAVRVDDVEETDAAVAQIRQDFGLRKTAELHGYHSGARLLERTLRLVLDSGQVTALILDKTTVGKMAFSLQATFGPPMLPEATALLVLERCLAAGAVRRIWCDEDIQESNRRRAFNTRVYQLARRQQELRQELRIDVKHYPSHKSSLIQLADMTAYALQRSLRSALETGEQRRLLRALQRKSENVIWREEGDDLRPYLLP